MYIRTREDALGVLAEILELPDPKARVVRVTVAVLSCLDAEPRRLLVDAQALLLEGGLDAPRLRRPALDAEGARVARRLDAMELTEVIRQVFPELRAERWLLARALLRGEAVLRDSLIAALRARGRDEERTRARRDVEAAVASARPAWMDRAGALRSACLAVVKGADVDDPHAAADRLFALLATSDDLADGLFREPESADSRLSRLLAAMEEVEPLSSSPDAEAA